jgi:hypothetical protein
MTDDRRLEELDLRTEKIEQCLTNTDTFSELKECMKNGYTWFVEREKYR